MRYIRMPEKAWQIIKGSEVMYLVPPFYSEVLHEKYIELFQAEPTAAFYEFVAENMNLVLDGERIAAEIEPVIMNLLDDKMNNRKLALRTGDYIVLQRAFRGMEAER